MNVGVYLLLIGLTLMLIGHLWIGLIIAVAAGLCFGEPPRP